jgi:hypothetical protein
MGKAWKTTLDGRRTETASWAEGQQEKVYKKARYLDERVISSTNKSENPR